MIKFLIGKTEKEKEGCGDFRKGCTCKECLDWYLKNYANKHTYG